MTAGPVHGNVFSRRPAGGPNSGAFAGLPNRPGPPTVNLLVQAINALFGNGEQGALYDPSDLSTLYQDSAGTTPVTADGDPVGLHLDVSQGLELGANVVTNGDFSDGLSGWGLTGASGATGWVASSGTALMDASAATPYRTIFQDVLTAGRYYKISLDVLVAGGGLSVVTGSFSGRYELTTAGRHEIVMNAITARFSVFSDADSVSQIDNVTVRELPGYHAVQATTAEKPLYDLTDGIHSVEHDLFDDNLVVNLPDLGTDATVKYVTSGGITTLTNQTISGDYTLPEATWQGAVIYEGPMSSAQADAVDAWLNAKAGL